MEDLNTEEVAALAVLRELTPKAVGAPAASELDRSEAAGKQEGRARGVRERPNRRVQHLPHSENFT